MAGRNGPSAKQRKFAKLVANGTSKADAYEKAYGANGGKRNTRVHTAYALASQPAMRELIEHYESQLVPIGDLRAEQENMLANLKYLAYDSPDHRVRVTASVKLFELLELYRERQHKYKHLAPAVPVDAVVSELLQIAESQPAIDLETVESENSSEPSDSGSEPAEETE
jgi:hypothetical protein